MPGSSVTLQNLLPTRAAEAVRATASARGSESSFASVLEKRIQASKPRETSVKAESKTNEPAVQDKKVRAQEDGASREEVRNPAKEKLKELQKKIRQTLEAMNDPELTADQLQGLAEQLNALLGAVKVLLDAAPPQAEMPEDGAETVEGADAEAGDAIQNVVSGTLAASTTAVGEPALETEAQTEPRDGQSEKIHGNSAHDRLNGRGNPILNQLEKILENQSDEIAASPELKTALEAALNAVKELEEKTVTPASAQVEEKLETLFAKLNAVADVKVTKSEAQAETEPETAVEAAPETPAVVTAAATQTANGEEGDEESPAYEEDGDSSVLQAKPATEKESKDTEKTKSDGRTPAIQAEKSVTTAARPSGQNEAMQIGQQSFDKTLEAVEQGVQAKGQLQSRIMEQVVEAVKTNFRTDDLKSEMIMKLKPESLGNVSLKVSVEKGIVLAEFQVESQAVKQALESNLQDLRSALQDKGFNVFDLDVSVRKDNQQSQQSPQDNRKGYRSGSAKALTGLDRMEARLMTLESIERESTIDYLG